MTNEHNVENKETAAIATEVNEQVHTSKDDLISLGFDAGKFQDMH